MRSQIQASESRLRGKIRDENKETRRHMLVLHEAVLERLRTIGEGYPREGA